MLKKNHDCLYYIIHCYGHYAKKSIQEMNDERNRQIKIKQQDHITEFSYTEKQPSTRCT